MLARAASINKDKILSINKRWWIIGYFTCAIIVCAFHFTPYKHTWAYSNPIVVIESFMFFSLSCILGLVQSLSTGLLEVL